ncbi:hypothetical protein GQ42DRAFT_162625 [Ramicandelaber brevisporus]|nr:hypothetical protein GQ42DRAFT_162625 [Ramicandelaber brevisporus]
MSTQAQTTKAPSILVELFDSDKESAGAEEAGTTLIDAAADRYQPEQATDEERAEYRAKLNRNTRRKFLVIALGLLLLVVLSTVFAFTIPRNSSSTRFIAIPWAILVVLEGVTLYFYRQEMKVNANALHHKDMDVEYKVDRRQYRQAEIIAQQMEIEGAIERRRAIAAARKAEQEAEEAAIVTIEDAKPASG